MERKFDEYSFTTRAIHVGNDVDLDSGAIKRPITMGNSYQLPYDPSAINWSGATANLYTRNGGTNQKYLQERVASLEGGEDCVALASGVAALIASICLAVFNISQDTAEEGLQIAQSSVVGLRMTMTVVPVAGLLAAVFYFYKKYSLTEEKVAEIAKKVKAMRNA